MSFSSLKNISPLKEYWKSDQNDEDEKIRLLKVNKASPASYLYEKEPYKWENLYQSISKEIVNGDNSSVKGLRLLLGTINSKEREKMLKEFATHNIFNEEVIALLRGSGEDIDNKPTKRNLFRFLRILFAIFTNPYNLEVKRKKVHLYEHTGSIVYSLRRPFL